MISSPQKIALGTVQFGLPYGVANQTGQIALEEAFRIIETARKAGVDTIDTAAAYGTSEKQLGTIGVSGFKIISKLPPIPKDQSDIEKWVFKTIETSLKDLRVEKIHGLLLHRPEDLLSKQGTTISRTLQKLRSEGLVSKTGLSLYKVHDIEHFCTLLPIDIIQTPFNLIDRSLVNQGTLQHLKDHQIEVHVRSIFLQGVLLLPETARPSYFSNWNYIWESWHSWLKHNSASPAQACLKYVQSFPQIDRIVIGCDSLQQFKETLSCAKQDPISDFPDISSQDEDLIDPSRWNL